MRFPGMSGAVLPIFFILFLVACSGGLSKAEHLNEAGVDLQLEGRFEDPIVKYDEAIRINSQPARAYTNRAGVYLIVGQPEEAIQDFNEAIRLDPDSAFLYANRALAYTMHGKDKAAQQDFDRAVELGIDRGALAGTIEELKKQR